MHGKRSKRHKGILIASACLIGALLITSCDPVAAPSTLRSNPSVSGVAEENKDQSDQSVNEDRGDGLGNVVPHPLVQGAGGLPGLRNPDSTPAPVPTLAPTPTPMPVDYNGNGILDGDDLAIGARKDTETVIQYVPDYVNTNEGYPDPLYGVCTDTIWRAFAEAGYSLKDMLDADILRSPDSYPKIERPDPNIDFRRVPNLSIFFRRYAQPITLSPDNPADWQPGDIVLYGEVQYHIGIVSDRLDDNGFPLLWHHAAKGPKEMPIFDYGYVTGHYRWDANQIPDEVIIPFERADETPDSPAPA